MAVKKAKGNRSYLGISEMNPDYEDVAPTAPVIHKLGTSTFNIDKVPTTVQDDTLRSDRRSSEYIQTGYDIPGSISFKERNYFSGADEPLLRSALFSGSQSDIDTTNGPSVDIEGAVITASGSTINFTGSTVNPDNITDYQKIRLVNTTNNDGIYTAVLSSGSTYTLTPAVTADETLGAGCLAQGRMIRDDSTAVPLFFEKGQTDTEESIYNYYYGVYCNTFAKNIPERDTITNTAELIGIESGDYDSTSYTDATYTEFSSLTEPVMASPKNVEFYINDSKTQCKVVSQDINVNNNLTPDLSADKYGICSVSVGNMEISLTMVLFYLSSVYKNMLYNETTFSTHTVLTDKLNAATCWSFPQVKLISDDTPTDSPDTISETVNADVEYDGDYGCKLQIDQFPAY